MSVNFGPLCRDIIGCNLQIKGKQVIDKNGNLQLQGNIQTKSLTVKKDATICGELQVDTISAKQASEITVSNDINASNVNAISVTTSGNVNVCGTLHADYISPKNNSNVVITQNLLVDGQVETTNGLFVNGIQVVSSQQCDPGNTNGNLTSTSDTCNLILQVLRNHGLIGYCD